MSTYATTLSEGFASKIIERYSARNVTDMITNNNYEGEITNTQSKVNILTFDDIDLRTYTGADMSTADDPDESVGTLTTDQKKAYYFKIKSLSRFQSWIKNPEGTLLDRLAQKLRDEVDKSVLLQYQYAKAGQWYGTNYTTGTVTIDASGNVTGSGTTFTEAMEGKPFKALGHTVWYRVKDYTSATAITIEKDVDDESESSDYDGGAIEAGATYVIQANTALTVAKSTIYTYLVTLKGYLDKVSIPTSDRFFVAPSDITNLLLLPDAANPLVVAVESSKKDQVENGYIGRIAGFDVYASELVNGDDTNGYHCLAGHKSGITHALGFTETGIEDLKANFGKAYKGLTVWGNKVVDERKKCLAHAYLKV